MESLATWLPLILGGLIVIALCIKVFTDKNITNYLGYGLVAALALCALPSIQHFSYNGSFGQITTDLQTKADTLNNNIGSQSATLQSQITLLDKKMDSVVSKLNATAEVQQQITPAYKQNNLLEALVYFGPSAQAEAEKIRDFLLDLGYKSSATFTDYSELSPPLPAHGSVRLVHTNVDQSIQFADVIRSKMQQNFPELHQITDQSVSHLNSGDVQIEVF
jgi:hypothetical protein